MTTTSQKDSNDKNKTIKWIFSVFFLLSFFSLVSKAFYLAAIIFFLVGILLLPPLEKVISSTIPILNTGKIKIITIGILIFIGLIILPKDNKNSSDGTGKTTMENISKRQKFILKPITSYYIHPYTKEGYKDIRTYYFGLYIELPSDTNGVSHEIINYLKGISKEVNKNEAVHLWVFTDSTVVPKSFEGEWETAGNTKKCFANAIKLTTGKVWYTSNPFGEFER